MELDYPRDMSMWGGLGNDIGTAFQHLDHKTYFFKGKGFWLFNDHLMEVAHERPRSSALVWMKCPRGGGSGDDREYVDERSSGRRGKFVAATASSAGALSTSMTLLLFLSIAGRKVLLLH